MMHNNAWGWGMGWGIWLIPLALILVFKRKNGSIYTGKAFLILLNFIKMENSIKHTYHIGGMSCGGCVAGVKQKLSAVAGVTSVSVDLANKQAEIISSEEIRTDILRNALSSTQYTISEL